MPTPGLQRFSTHEPLTTVGQNHWGSPKKTKILHKYSCHRRSESLWLGPENVSFNNFPRLIMMCNIVWDLLL